MKKYIIAKIDLVDIENRFKTVLSLDGITIVFKSKEDATSYAKYYFTVTEEEANIFFKIIEIESV